jgi:hypothetical protein
MPTSIDALATTPPPPLASRHELTVTELLAQAEKIKQAMTRAMEEGVHFGTIPGTPKPTLLKAGAEKLCLLFRMDPEYESHETIDGEHLTVKSKCTLWHVPSGQRLGSGEGLATTRENKYAYRKGPDGARRTNPDLFSQWNEDTPYGDRARVRPGGSADVRAARSRLRRLETRPREQHGG